MKRWHVDAYARFAPAKSDEGVAAQVVAVLEWKRTLDFDAEWTTYYGSEGARFDIAIRGLEASDPMIAQIKGLERLGDELRKRAMNVTEAVVVGVDASKVKPGEKLDA